eukprot:gene17984-biopygen18200
MVVTLCSSSFGMPSCLVNELYAFIGRTTVFISAFSFSNVAMRCTTYRGTAPCGYNESVVAYLLHKSPKYWNSSFIFVGPPWFSGVTVLLLQETQKDPPTKMFRMP